MINWQKIKEQNIKYIQGIIDTLDIMIEMKKLEGEE
tara:strand:- start:936 stop:1043 length:108 start_codon:yes stop_codon:yes gene_type:complete